MVTVTAVGGGVVLGVCGCVAGWVAAAARGLRGQMMRVTQGVNLYMRVLYSISLVFFGVQTSSCTWVKCQIN